MPPQAIRAAIEAIRSGRWGIHLIEAVSNGLQAVREAYLPEINADHRVFGSVPECIELTGLSTSSYSSSTGIRTFTQWIPLG